MNNNNDRKYKSVKIPGQISFRENSGKQIKEKTASDIPVSFQNPDFAEIRVDGNTNFTSSNFIPKSQPIKPVTDEHRERFNAMRQIAREVKSLYSYNSKFYNPQVQDNNSKVFYKQAVFMNDFEDNFSEVTPFSSYFPYYQMMGYEQLRTYFTWRTAVRKGDIKNISLSYAFVYTYELLNNIGVNNPQDGLDKLMMFWRMFREYNTKIDDYITKWLKDYHIYYDLPKSFKDFIIENELQMYYPNICSYEPENKDYFELLKKLSKYQIKESSFYSDETSQIINDCFCFVIRKVKQSLKEADIHFDDLVFQSNIKLSVWKPFKGALFFPQLDMSDKKVVFSETEIYICKQNRWFFSPVITMGSGKQLISYIIKQMESALRKIMHYKYKLSANTSSINNELLQKLNDVGLSLEKIVNNAVSEYYTDLTKIVVSVNKSALSQIRLEALDTQDKLTVPENEILGSTAAAQTNDIPVLTNITRANNILTSKDTAQTNNISTSTNTAQIKDISASTNTAQTGLSVHSIDKSSLSIETASASDDWTALKDILTEIEKNALVIILQGQQDIKLFSDDNGIMLEVLADSINEKALDCIGDNILELDDDMIIYDEYKEKVIKMVKK